MGLPGIPALGEKLGPAPAWLWIGGGAAVIAGVGFYLKHRAPSAASSTATGPPLNAQGQPIYLGAGGAPSEVLPPSAVPTGGGDGGTATPPVVSPVGPAQAPQNPGLSDLYSQILAGQREAMSQPGNLLTPEFNALGQDAFNAKYTSIIPPYGTPLQASGSAGGQAPAPATAGPPMASPVGPAQAPPIPPGYYLPGYQVFGG